MAVARLPRGTLPGPWAVTGSRGHNRACQPGLTSNCIACADWRDGLNPGRAERYYSLPVLSHAGTRLGRRIPGATPLRARACRNEKFFRRHNPLDLRDEYPGRRAGEAFPLQKYILCAHFDASGEDTQDSIAPGADDNATGTAAVLEAARLLSRYQGDYTVLYALWDCEEAGTLGSDAYAKAARARGDSILGVINLDMLGCSRENDRLMLVAGGSLVPRARELGDTVAQLSQLYKIDLEPVRVFPGIESSDHISFARQKYPAIVLSEYPIDFTSFNGKSSDRITSLNLPYYHRQVNLAVATLAFLAGMNAPSGVGVAKDLPATYHIEQNYPNPFNPITTIRYGLPRRSHVLLTIYNTLGQNVAELVNGEIEAGYHEAQFDARNLGSGVYFYRLQAGSFVEARKLLLVR